MIDWGAGMTNVIIAMVIAIDQGFAGRPVLHASAVGQADDGIIFCSTLFFLGLFLIGCYTDQVARPWPEPTNLKPPVAKPGQPGLRLGH